MSVIALPPTLAARVAALTRRERILLLSAAGLALVVLAYVLFRPSAEPAPTVAVAPPPPPAVFTPPPPVVQPLPAAPAADPAAIAGLVLHGVMGGGPTGGAAIIGNAQGEQRTVRVGRPVVPGATLKEVAVRHVILATGSGDMRLEFNKAARPDDSTAIAAPAVATAAAGQADRQRQTNELRLATAPRLSGGDVMGYAIKPGARSPLLAAAGMQPGDVLVAVGSDMIDSEERLFNIPNEIGAEPVTVTFERNGRKMTGTIGPPR